MRNPYNLKNKMKMGELESLAPGFDWKTYYRDAKYPTFRDRERGVAEVLQADERVC